MTPILPHAVLVALSICNQHGAEWSMTSSNCLSTSSYCAAKVVGWDAGYGDCAKIQAAAERIKAHAEKVARERAEKAYQRKEQAAAKRDAPVLRAAEKALGIKP